jgi:murein DD-endopeptidase MepM/ murein hydrolase activator NlpD
VATDELIKAQVRQEKLAAQIKAQQEAVKQLNELQDRLKSAIKDTSDALKGINADLVAVRASIVDMTAQITTMQAKYDSLVIELASLDAHLVELRREERAKRVELTERQAVLADRLRDAYDGDRVSMLETFLSGGSFADVLAEIGYFLDAGNQDKALAEQVKKDQATLASLHESVEMTRGSTNVLRQETAVHKQELDRELVQLEQTQENLRALEAETAGILKEQQKSYDQLAKNKKALQASITRTDAAKTKLSVEINKIIERQRISGNIPSEYNGLLSWPLVGVVSGEFGCSSFEGYGPAAGCAHFHNGIDIVQPCGTEIKAAGPGTVAYIGWNYADGFDPAWIVVIAHASNLQTWYAHMTPTYPPGILPGATVTTGQVIGYEGATGHATGCHLHWMVQLDGAFSNPRLFL